MCCLLYLEGNMVSVTSMCRRDASGVAVRCSVKLASVVLAVIKCRRAKAAEWQDAQPGLLNWLEIPHTFCCSNAPGGAPLGGKVATAYVQDHTFGEAKDTKTVLSNDGLATHLLYLAASR